MKKGSSTKLNKSGSHLLNVSQNSSFYLRQIKTPMEYFTEDKSKLQDLGFAESKQCKTPNLKINKMPQMSSQKQLKSYP